MSKNQSIKIGLGIPTLNRYDLLSEAFLVYKDLWSKHPVIILDNGFQNIPDDSWYKLEMSKKNKGVARSWNFLSNQLFDEGCTHALILNDDVVFDKKPEDIEDFIENNSADFYRTFQHLSVFVLPKTTQESIGFFDVGFHPAYFEDNDFLYRLKLENKQVITNSFFDPVVFRNSMTIAKDPGVNSNFSRNAERYVEKWGGPPGQEKFLKPFNK